MEDLNKLTVEELSALHRDCRDQVAVLNARAIEIGEVHTRKCAEVSLAQKLSRVGLSKLEEDILRSKIQAKTESDTSDS